MLVERRPDLSWYPRARNLNFRTLEVFRGLGLEAQVIAARTHFSQTLREPCWCGPTVLWRGGAGRSRPILH